MARGKHNGNARSRRVRRWWSAKDRGAKFATVGVVLRACLAIGLIAGTGIGLAYLDRNVHTAARFHLSPLIELVDVPDGLRDTMTAKLAPFEAVSEFDPRICAKIGQALEADPWVRRVTSVRRTHDLRITASCEYRLPAALVQIDSGFYLVDEQQVRLPGVYGYQETLPLIQGVDSDPPPPGEIWDVPDLGAGMALARLIVPERFYRQITGIQVHNYGGRRSASNAHIVLTTDRAGRVINWGSAPGEEVEENSAQRKIAILRHNYERYGRVDAGFGMIDISVYPDRFTTNG
ncbi:MAG: hypothetical protein KAV82_12335 [Phycisphaerae bacterium]|nr:hypothetical protein [Phycisphaerae bacterium]